jgi:hypothetical protein
MLGLVEVQNAAGAALPIGGGASTIQAAFNSGGRIILDDEWNKYARAKLGNPTNGGFTVRVPVTPPIVTYELVIVMGETAARAYGSPRSAGNNQYTIAKKCARPLWQLLLHRAPVLPTALDCMSFSKFVVLTMRSHGRFIPSSQPFRIELEQGTSWMVILFTSTQM